MDGTGKLICLWEGGKIGNICRDRGEIGEIIIMY
jgi:hypothetical protein